MKIQKLLEALNELLEPEKFRDYCPNGLQVQGKKEVKNIVCGVSASEALINEAVKRDADTIIVHHGYFWKNENPSIIGIKRCDESIENRLCCGNFRHSRSRRRNS